MEYNGKIAVEIFRESRNYSHIIHEWDHITSKEFETKNDEILQETTKVGETSQTEATTENIETN
jgi:hypothetical protein